MKRPILVSVILLLNFGLGIAQTEKSQPVESCNPKGHLKCIQITANEVFADGAEGSWSKHWGRISYIGEACIKEYGEKKGKRLELLFAPPHYIAMFFVNVGGLIKYTFSNKEYTSPNEPISSAISDQ